MTGYKKEKIIFSLILIGMVVLVGLSVLSNWNRSQEEVRQERLNAEARLLN
ncbi:hypothetical protein ACFL0L_05425 [Patescibacteria group bacterium]